MWESNPLVEFIIRNLLIFQRDEMDEMIEKDSLGTIWYKI